MGHYITINIISYSPEIDYFQPHYLDITFNDALSRKDLGKNGILTFTWATGDKVNFTSYLTRNTPCRKEVIPGA